MCGGEGGLGWRWNGERVREMKVGVKREAGLFEVGGGGGREREKRERERERERDWGR